ncbi:MAG TPA: pyridoxal-dependent decarboxylase [Myxococcales bacterium]|nr:pyridoxal-dependent decarboxylase [Myxococcales bacterium]
MDPLELDRETMRAMGHAAVDLLVDRISTLHDQPAWRGATRAEMDARVLEPPPEQPHDFTGLLRRLRGDVLAWGARVDHPRFFAFVPGSPTWPGILGEAIAAAHQAFAGTWLGGAGVAGLELVVLEWFRQWLGLPQGASGLLLSGGSMANLTALAAARADRLGEDFADATLYFSSETHSSVARACRVLGFRKERLRVVPATRRATLPLDELQRAIDADRAAGLRPFALIANAGTTTAGAIDELAAAHRIARENGMWFHVDAAYGGFAILTERGKRWLRGIELADSVTLDPHKWLHQPFETGCLLVRDPATLIRAFRIMPDYLKDTEVAGAEVNFADRGIQLTRSARGLKIWLSLQYFGVAAFREAIDAALDHALAAQRYVEQSHALELLSPAQLGIVCFRRLAAGRSEAELDELNGRVLSKLMRSGFAMVSSTRVDGRLALRLCILNHRSSREDVIGVLRWIEDCPAHDPSRG